MHRHSIRLAAACAALLLAAPALAAPGLKLSWDHCSADGRIANKLFACDSNAGSDLLVLSFDPSVGFTNGVGLELTVFIKSSSGSMPAWWQLATGGCRAGALTYDLSAAAAGTCEYPFAPTLAGGIAGYTADYAGPGSWRVRAAVAVPSDQPFTVTPGLDHFAMGLVVRHTKTVGTGACEGCATPMCIGFGSMRLVTVLDANNAYMSAGGPNTGGGEATATWQGAYVRDFTAYRELFTEFASMTCDPDASVPTRHSTWGAVKSLYH